MTSPFGLIVAIVIPLSVYFVPSIIAVTRKVRTVSAVAVVNTFLGWTVIGWFVALFMATRPQAGFTAASSYTQVETKANGWYADPTRRHEFRYFDGTTWTSHVSDGGVASTDAASPPVSPGAVLTKETLGSWGQRAVGFLIDVGCVAAIGFVGVALQKIAGVASLPLGFVVGFLVSVGAVAFWIAQIVRQGRTGQTIGQQVVGLKLIDARSGDVVGGGTAVLRAIAHLFDSIACYVGGWLLPLFDQKHQTLADKIVGTVVIRVPKQPVTLYDLTVPRRRT